MDDAATMSPAPLIDGDDGFTIGIEEELFLVHREGWDCVREMPGAFRRDAREALADAFKLELAASIVEIVTRPNGSMSELARELRWLRLTLAQIAERHGLAVLAVGTHPFADWKEQTLTRRPRYGRIASSLQMISKRVHACGLHVHVAVADPEQRISAMNRIQRYLPVFLALSTSSPFWCGVPTGLKGYRTAANDETPRSGLPGRFSCFDEYQRYVGRLTAARFIPDASYLWWAVRPSSHYPTLELRIPDACTRVEDTIALAALYRALVHLLVRDSAFAADWEDHHRLVNDENRWQATRYGIEAELLDPVTGACAPVGEVTRELLRILDEAARALGCTQEIEAIEAILDRGTSADRQIQVYQEAIAAGATPPEAARRVAGDVAELTASS